MMDRSAMKQKNLNTTGSALQVQEQPKKIGTPLGKNGFAQQLKGLALDEVAKPEDIAQCHQWFQDLSKRPLKELTETEKTDAKQLIDWVSKPSPRAWLSSRIVTLLSHYFITQTDERVAKAAAEDWIEILREMPPWAVLAACRSYLAGDNCRKKPMAGDILKLAKKQMGIVFLAKSSLLERDSHKDEDNFIPLSEEDRSSLAIKIEAFKKKMAEKQRAFYEDKKQSGDDIAKSARKWSEFEDVDEGISIPTPSEALLQTPILKKDG